MPRTLTLLSSMAARSILADLLASYRTHTGRDVHLIAVGGLDAVSRIKAGEAFDIVSLGADAIEGLADDGLVDRSSVSAFARSPTAMAVPAGAPHPANCSEGAIKSLVEAAKRVALSTGPSGIAIKKLLREWRLPGETERRVVQAPPGVPVARLLAGGEAEVGFQQLAELLDQPGIEIVGPLPETVLPMTVFSLALSPPAASDTDAQALLVFLLSAAADAAKRRYGMEPPA